MQKLQSSQNKLLGQSRILQLNEGRTSLVNIWGPFAGWGSRTNHNAWLLNNYGTYAEKAVEAITKRFKERAIPNANIDYSILKAQGLIVENRPFYVIQRGATKVAVFIGRFGQDLYISQATYVRGPIDPRRVAIVALMMAFVLLPLLALNDLGSAFYRAVSTGGLSIGFITYLAACLSPLSCFSAIAIVLLILASLLKFITDYDFLAPLRAAPNEFQTDDVIALQKAVEETIRQTLDEIGIEVSLFPPGETYNRRLF